MENRVNEKKRMQSTYKKAKTQKCSSNTKQLSKLNRKKYKGRERAKARERKSTITYKKKSILSEQTHTQQQQQQISRINRSANQRTKNKPKQYNKCAVSTHLFTFIVCANARNNSNRS